MLGSSEVLYYSRNLRVTTSKAMLGSLGALCGLQVQDLHHWLVGTTTRFRRRNVDTVTALMGKRCPLTGTVQASLTHLVSKESEILIKHKGHAKHSAAALGKRTPAPPCCGWRGRSSSTLLHGKEVCRVGIPPLGGAQALGWVKPTARTASYSSSSGGPEPAGLTPS